MAKTKFAFCETCGRKVSLKGQFCAVCGADLGIDDDGGELDHTSKPVTLEKASVDEGFTEADNVGTRLETFERAHVFWLASLAKKSNGVSETSDALIIEKTGDSPPFVAYTFKDRETQESALTSLSFIKRARDTGNIISTELINIGYYEAAPGVFEALIFGEEFTPEMHDEAMEKLAALGGTLKDHKEPPQKSVQKNAATVAFPVTFVRTDKIELATYHTYRGPGKEAAITYLKMLPQPKKFEYHVVETPEGNFGRDIEGMFEE